MKRILFLVFVWITTIVSANAITMGEFKRALEENDYECKNFPDLYVKVTPEYISLYKIFLGDKNQNEILAIAQIYEYSEEISKSGKTALIDFSPMIYFPDFFDYFEAKDINTDYEPDYMEHGVKVLYQNRKIVD